MSKLLTDKENEILSKTAELWNTLRLLPELHADDIHELRGHIHAIQNIIMSRPVMREMKEKQS